MYLPGELTLIAPMSGILGALAMLLFMYIVSFFLKKREGSIESIGLFFDHSRKHPFLAAVLVYTLYGIIFSFLYKDVFQIVPHDATFRGLELGIFLGFLQGLVASIVLVIFIKEHHPILKFRRRGIFIALSNLLAHLLYGAIVGVGVDLAFYL